VNLVELSVKRPVFAWILMASIVIFGAISLNRLGVSQMPDIDFPVLSIGVNYEGAAPQVVEAEILEPLEERLLSIEGVTQMSSSARQGAGSVTLEFDIDRDVNVALQEVQSALGQLRLPPGVDPPVVRKQNPEEDPILIVSVSAGSGEFRELIDWTNEFLLDQLRFLPGVGEVGVGGFSERNLRIWLDKEKLVFYELTISDVVDALRTQHLENAAGQFTSGDQELRVRWLGEATDPKEVGDIRILRRGGREILDRAIRIRDVARVEDGLSDIRRLARFDGKPAVAIQVRKQRGTNEVTVAEAVQDRLKELKDRFPEGYSYRVNVDFTQSTKSTVGLTVEKLWIAAAITILVCFLFLGNLSSALNILFSIPVSIVGTFTILYFSGFTLNLFTLLALTLSISIVVDDAIMLLENIVRHSRMGKRPTRAAIDGSLEVLPAATAATLAVLAVFLPVIFMDGVIGRFFFQFGVTMSAAVILSLLEAVTITPMRAAAFLRAGSKTNRFELALDHGFEKFSDRYRRSLVPFLKRPGTTVLVSTALFALSLVSLKYVRQEFVPAQDQNLIILSAQTPPGTSLARTDEMASKIEAILKTQKEVAGYFVSVGAGGPAASTNQIFMPLTLVPKSERSLKHTDVMNELRKKFSELKGGRVVMRDISTRNLSSGRPNPIALSVRGPDLQVLQTKTRELVEFLEQQKLGVDVDTDYREGLPELLITPNREAMAARSVSVDQVGAVLAGSVGGIRQGRFTREGRRFDVRFKVEESQILKKEDLGRLFVRTTAGQLIRLTELVTITESRAAQAISRVNRQRAITVTGNIAPGQSQGVVLERLQSEARRILPTGYGLALEGASAGFAQSFKSLSGALWIGILIAYMVLAVQFNSFLHPIPVLMALPFSVSGAFLSLWAFDVSINLFSFIGLIVLMGIAKKNSILLVEFTNQVRARGVQAVDQALLEACPVRLRPIIMTSVATVAAALPLLIPGGLGAETRIPMGLAIVGGTLVSTVLTLYVVPAMYLWMKPLERPDTSP
jgi:hydrophobe/amphiphile efflux-1 (HAE1) family protein